MGSPASPHAHARRAALTPPSFASGAIPEMGAVCKTSVPLVKHKIGTKVAISGVTPQDCCGGCLSVSDNASEPPGSAAVPVYKGENHVAQSASHPAGPARTPRRQTAAGGRRRKVEFPLQRQEPERAGSAGQHVSEHP